jgi:hypothetical protein
VHTARHAADARPQSVPVCEKQKLAIEKNNAEREARTFPEVVENAIAQALVATSTERAAFQQCHQNDSNIVSEKPTPFEKKGWAKKGNKTWMTLSQEVQAELAKAFQLAVDNPDAKEYRYNPESNTQKLK